MIKLKPIINKEESISLGHHSWVITLPKTISWQDYEKELEYVKSGHNVMNFRVPNIPKNLAKGDKCYLVWNGQIRGYMYIVGTIKSDGFKCDTTGVIWPKGNYIQRSGNFYYINNGEKMQGFRGIKKYEI